MNGSGRIIPHQPATRFGVFAPVLVALALAATVSSFKIPGAPDGMVFITGGSQKALYTSLQDTSASIVQPFLFDAGPVTNANFLAFVRENPEWRRSSVTPLFADAGYLAHWAGDLDLGADARADQPVVNVSWFAATAYAKWVGKRLPTAAEWELAAGDGRSGEWGLEDMRREWVSDFSSAMVTGDGRNNSDVGSRLFCGGAALDASDPTDYAAFLRFAFRSSLEARYTVANLGFRTARNV